MHIYMQVLELQVCIAVAMFSVSYAEVPFETLRQYQTGLYSTGIFPADFDGDGVMEVAAVVTPHLRGELTYYKRVGRQLKRFAAKGGFSTHFIGSRILGMSVVLDANGDGRPDIVAPSLDRETLHAATLAGDGAVKIVRTVRHDSPIVTAIVAHDIDGQGMADIVYGLENGVIVLIRR